MAGAQPRSKVGRIYLLAVPWVGTAVLLWALTDLLLYPPDSSWWALAALTILTGSFTVKIPGLVARLSVSEPFVFAATLWFGPSVGAVTAALDALIMSLWLMPGLKTVHRLTFNVSVLVISIWTASQVFFSVSGIDPRAPEYPSLTTFVGPLYLFTACCFLLNSGMIATALAIERRQSGLRIWREQFLWLSLNYFGGASVAALLVVYAKSIDWAVIGLIVPLLAISYLTFRTTLGRLEDANAHLTELNQLHLSTIETLAMAVDAKDQVTHGHIRRVQRYALGLSKYLGITDEKTLKAVEAAALLHDMGKLAIPEYILNKPGKLSAAEFEKMKLHAGLGADILSAIEFPYPVVPIVRHHHENWDGGGYPDKLKGTEIPLGARILSVVDCYDALTSDRPYRPRLTNEEAIRIVMQRRGSMYDPLVVDTFVERLAELEETARDLEPVNPTLLQIAELNAAPLPVEGRTEVPVGRPNRPALRREDLAPLALGLMGHIEAAVGCAFYLAVGESTTLTVVSTAGMVPTRLLGNQAEIGDRVVGWSAATGLPVHDASFELEFGSAEHSHLLSISAFPGITPTGSRAVLVVFSESRGLSPEESSEVAEIAVSLIESLTTSDSKAVGQVALGSPLLSRLLPIDRDVAAACFPIGIIAMLPVDGRPISEAAVRSAVRASDNVVILSNGALLVVLQQASEMAVSKVIERLRDDFEVDGHLPSFEWTVLKEFTERVEGHVSDLIRTLGHGVGGARPHKFH